MGSTKLAEPQTAAVDDNTQREDITEGSSEAKLGTENATTNKSLSLETWCLIHLVTILRTAKGSPQVETSDSKHEEEERRVEGAPSELNGRNLGTALSEDPQGENILMRDMLVGLTWMAEDPMKTRSLSEDLEQAQALSNLGASAYERFGRTASVGDIEEAIEHWEVAAALVPSSHLARLDLISDLVGAYVSRFEHLGEISDLKKAIDSGTEAVSSAPDGHPYKPGCLNQLGIAYATRFESQDELADLNRAIECLSQAILLTPHSHTDRPGRLNDLAHSYTIRFERLGELSDLNSAIECQAQAISLIVDDEFYKTACLSIIGNSYTTRFERLGDLSDLNKAVECRSLAASLTPEGHPDKPRTLNSLGASYVARFERVGELSDLKKAIECQSQAFSLTPDGHVYQAACLGNIGNSYTIRFEHVGEVSDLNKAIACLVEAVSIAPDGHPYKPECLINLGKSYTIRFGSLGELSDLNKAIECQTEALSFISDDHQHKPLCCDSLGSAHMFRFESLGELSDLNKAIECLVQAVSLTPDGHPYRPGRLSNLGISYSARFDRLGDLSDLNEAIKSQACAVALTPDGSPDEPKCLDNLGMSCRARFERLGEHSDLNKAIESQARAVLLTPDNHPYKPACLSKLGLSYQTRFEHLGELSDLNTAIESHERAVSLTPDGHLYKPGYLNYLGIAYTARFKRLGVLSDLNSAGSFFMSASQSLTGPASVRFHACRLWARQSVQLSSFDPASSPLPAYQRAMSLIPQLVWIGNTIGRRYEHVSEVSSFATEATSYAISIGSYNVALEWLEAGRSIVWGQISRLRSPFEELSSRRPELAERLANIGRQLEHAGSRSFSSESLKTNGPDLAQEATSHIGLALEWDRILEEIRSTPGLEDFLRSPTANQLLSAANAHPVAILNLHQSRCDALIIRPESGTISHVSLPSFSSKDAVSARHNVFHQVRDRKPGPRLNPLGSLPTSLENIWTGVIQPVLEHLGYTRKLPVDRLPCLTWCTTGLLSFLPLHAARSLDESQPSVFDLVISSYTPSLSALISNQSGDPTSACGILAVGQENTPNQTSLPYTTKELAAIHKRMQHGYYLQLEDSEATVKQVLDTMDEFSWVHMACHGSQDPYDPMQSAFHLHDGSLSLAAITKRSFTNKGLAFLSACQTATGDKNMPDEAVHLAAGMLMAGYPSVIGTMWSIADEDGPEVADAVYAELLKDGKMDYTKSARALHQAVARLREKVGKEDIARWAPFIHMGC